VEKATSQFVLPALAAACACCLVGSSFVGTRLIVDAIDPLVLALFRFTGAAACLVPLAVVFAPRQRIAARDLIPMTMLGFIYFGLFPWLLTASVKYTTPTHAAFVGSLTPMLTLLLATALGREVISPYKLFGVITATVGVGIALSEKLSQDAAVQNLFGDGLMLLAACASTVWGVFSRPYIARYSTVTITAYGITVGVFGLLILALASGLLAHFPALQTDQWTILALLAIPGCALPFYLLAWAYGRAAPTRIAVFLTLPPLVVMIISVPLLHEPLTLPQIIGFVLVAFGIVTVNRPASRMKPADLKHA
jgi:drug/metabolite transporter (DMT)-like permease